MNYYDEIKNKLIDDEIYSKVKDYSKERHKVITYFEIGRILNGVSIVLYHIGQNFVSIYLY